ncbi:MarR family transcriptional regulator [Longispora sp. K20-0274]|uniref:MarR family winged helix-turn-helix transcriptional regulator n=1 Tax=Longispora sp. K20-0274 TaxID=3088255 RepID=UPI003999CB68
MTSPPPAAYFQQLMARRRIIGLCRAGSAATRIGESAAGAHDLGLTQYLVLDMLATVGPRSQQELSEGLRTDRTTMVGTVDALETAGLVARERNPNDRRAYIVTITDPGRAALAAVDADADALEAQFLGRLSEAERALLVELLGKILIAP